MTLQSNGAISFSNLQTEFGGSNPISLSEYYRGGAYVPSSSSVNIPTSGAIKLSNFYGATAIDLIPDALSNESLSYLGTIYNTGSTIDLSSSTKTITGINAQITLNISFNCSRASSINIYKNGAYITSISSGGNYNMAMNNNDNMQFIYTGGWELDVEDTGTIVIKNSSNSNTTLYNINITTLVSS